MALRVGGWWLPCGLYAAVVVFVREKIRRKTEAKV